jgi:hypothetical protein
LPATVHNCAGVKGYVVARRVKFFVKFRALGWGPVADAIPAPKPSETHGWMFAMR